MKTLVGGEREYIEKHIEEATKVLRLVQQAEHLDTVGDIRQGKKYWHAAAVAVIDLGVHNASYGFTYRLLVGVRCKKVPDGKGYTQYKCCCGATLATSALLNPHATEEALIFGQKHIGCVPMPGWTDEDEKTLPPSDILGGQISREEAEVQARNIWKGECNGKEATAWPDQRLAGVYRVGFDIAVIRMNRFRSVGSRPYNTSGKSYEEALVAAREAMARADRADAATRERLNKGKGTS